MSLNTTSLTYDERAKLCINPTAKGLLTLMEDKATNLALAADVTSTKELLDLIHSTGPEICVLKTHIDIIDDFKPDLIQTLQSLAQKYRFFIFEDRKFADIGNTVQSQYKGGIYRIADWSSITNAHTIPGPGIIEGLRQIGLPKGNGLLLLAEMSSEGSLATGEYTRKTVEMAKQYPDFVIGFIARGRVDEDPCFITMTPGVKLSEGKDTLGQQYLTPQKVIIHNKSDIIIVGRDIISALNPSQVARHYRKVAWDAYRERC